METDPREPEEMGTDPNMQAPIAECDSLSDFDDLVDDQLSDDTPDSDD